MHIAFEVRHKSDCIEVIQYIRNTFNYGVVEADGEEEWRASKLVKISRANQKQNNNSLAYGVDHHLKGQPVER